MIEGIDVLFKSMTTKKVVCYRLARSVTVYVWKYKIMVPNAYSVIEKALWKSEILEVK